MNYGFLSDHFEGIAAKRLSDVEINPERSNQHELNGINEFKGILGEERRQLAGRYIYLADDNDQILKATGALKWYDAREKDAKRSPEYRLYYTANGVLQKASTGDILVICKERGNRLFIIVAPEGSTSEAQILWMFGLSVSNIRNKFVIRRLSEERKEIGFAAKLIFEELGLEIKEEGPDYLQMLLDKFGNGFPNTNEFSEYTRSLIEDADPIKRPDETLLLWMEHEEMLFKTLENHFIKKRLQKGFGKDNSDVDAFISYSLSVQNRRKSRAGKAFENHLSVIFNSNNIHYSKGEKTERKNKPDFLFPGILNYNNHGFPEELLTMLGVKTTAKDRWRQILTEADRIKKKHLITLEPAISQNQTDEMISQQLTLVIPKGIINTYTISQRKHLMTVSDFIIYLREKQSISLIQSDS